MQFAAIYKGQAFLFLSVHAESGGKTVVLNMVSVRKSWEVRRIFYYTKVMVSFGENMLE